MKRIGLISLVSLLFVIALSLLITPLFLRPNRFGQQDATSKTEKNAIAPTPKKTEVGLRILCPFMAINNCKKTVEEKALGLDSLAYDGILENTPILSGVDGEYMLDPTLLSNFKVSNGETLTIISVKDSFREAKILYIFRGNPVRELTNGKPANFLAGQTIGFIGPNQKLRIIEARSREESIKLFPSEDGKALIPQN